MAGTGPVTGPPLVRTHRQLEALGERLKGSPYLALDTEFLTERTYYPRLCLVQIATDDVVAAVDPLECGDAGPLTAVLEEGPELVLHAGSQDLGILERWTGVVPEVVFDTQVAAAFVGFGHSVSYARLVSGCCGVQLSRSRAYTDWSRRPLEPEQIDYALDDVRYLPRCWRHLRDELGKRGRLAWALEECEAARESALERVAPADQWRRVSGARRLDGRRLAVLQELARWREEEAMRRDEPRGRIAPDRVLVELAHRRVRDASRLKGMRGLHPREASRSGEAIVAAIERGLERPRDTWPAWPAGSGAPDDPGVPVVATLLDAFLRARAAEADVSTRLLANRAELERLVRHQAADGDGAGAVGEADGPVLLRGWRREVAGDDLLRILRGELRLGVGRSRGHLAVTSEEV